MSLPDVVSRDEWLAARKELLAKEKDLTRRRDALNAERRRLPMVRIEKDYRFEGPDGEATLLDLFEGRRQLIIGHFMFDPSWEDGCPSCSAGADEVAPGLLAHLHVRDTTLAYVSRAPLDEDRALQGQEGLDVPVVLVVRQRLQLRLPRHASTRTSPRSSTTTARRRTTRRRGTGYYLAGDQPIESPGLSCFLRDGDDVFHTYSIFARGGEMTGGSYYFLDLTALGRQEEWEEPKGRAADPRGATPDFAA